MKNYRAYLLDSEGNIRAMRRIECDSDKEALLRLKALAGRQRMEVWTDARKVGGLNPDSKSALPRAD